MEGSLCPPSDPGFRLIETFRWEPGRGILRRERHLSRLAHSAARLGIEPQGIEAALTALGGDTPLRVRLTVDIGGKTEITTAPFVPLTEGAVWRIAIAQERLRSDDPWLRVKTTQRRAYDVARKELPKGVDEVIFLNKRDEICEGTITNIFAGKRGRLLTPPVSCGVLPGILREEKLAHGAAEEALLSVDDLQRATELYVGNSLRGLIPARLA